MKTPVAKAIVHLTICAAALLLSNRFCFADTCPAHDTEPTRGPEETLDHAYQPPDGDILQRYRFVPPNAGPNDKFPTVLLLPPDVFYHEYGDEGVPSEGWAAYDLQQARFLVFTVNHRLAPPGALTGQLLSTISGRFPQQTDDLKRQILAALADPRCDGRIYLVGGSAGGCLALYVMLDSAGVLNLGWNDAARTKIKAVVSLSGLADLCDWRNPGEISDDDLTKFKQACDDYVNLPQNPPTQDCSKLTPASPVSLVSNATSSPAVLLFGTKLDPVPYQQALDMYAALTGKFGVSPKFQKYAPLNDTGDHAYHYWHSYNVAASDCVSHQVITFLQNNP